MQSLAKRRAIPQSTISCIATIGCIGVLLFLIATTIVLALIPLYISHKEVSLNPYTLRSNDIITTMEIEENEDVTSRRKRTTGDLSDFVGGTFDTTGDNMVNTKLLATLPSTIVSDLSISKISIAYEATARRRRFALSKRAANSPNNPIVLVIQYYIIYRSSCMYKCQINTASMLQQKIYDIPSATFVFTNIPIFKNGVFYKYAPRIVVIRVVYVSQISPGLSSATTVRPPVNVTLSATTATVTTSTITGAILG